MLTDVVNMSIKIQPHFLLHNALMPIFNNIRTNADISILALAYVYNPCLFLRRGHKVAVNLAIDNRSKKFRPEQFFNFLVIVDLPDILHAR